MIFFINCKKRKIRIILGFNVYYIICKKEENEFLFVKLKKQGSVYVLFGVNLIYYVVKVLSLVYINMFKLKLFVLY